MSILFPSPLIKVVIVLTAKGINSIAAETRLIIAATNLGSIVIPLPLVGVCKSISFFIISFEIPFPRAIDSNSRCCFSSSFACLFAKPTEAVVPAADTNAEIPLITNGTSASNGIALPSLIITSLKVELSDELKCLSGNSVICSLFKNLDFNFLQIEHRTLLLNIFFVSLFIIIAPVDLVKS